MVEALATGTPVVAHRLGSLPEIVRDGVTGCWSSDVDQAVQAVGAAGGLRRAECRRDAQQRFSAERMVDDYVRLFERVASGAGAR